MTVDQFMQWIKWKDGSSFNSASTKQIYNMLKDDCSIFDRVDHGWGLGCSTSRWQFIFNFF